MLGDKRLIQSIKLQNFLSFGPDAEEIELKSLNVLIGPNASGKSNLMEAIGFLRASPIDLGLPIRDGGGVIEWLWKGLRRTPTAEVNATIHYPEAIVGAGGWLKWPGDDTEMVAEKMQKSSIGNRNG